MHTPGTLEYYGVSPRRKKFKSLDLFSGAGGLSLGLEWAGFKAELAVEFDKAAADSYDANFGNLIARAPTGEPLSIADVDFSAYKGMIDLVVGGPPCQGFSPLGKQLKDDPRNSLWREFMRAVEEVEPKAFLMENVPELLKAEEGAAAIRLARDMGYNVISDVLFAEQYGVPQKRRRAFILGIRDSSPAFPKPETDIKTVKWAFKGLPLNPDDANWHIGRAPTAMSLERYKTVPEGGNRFDLRKARPDITPPCWLNKDTGSTDVFGRLWWNKPALTIRTEFYKPEKGRYLHPVSHRPITHREAARLQTFPDDFIFKGSKSDVAKQIGNAVPAMLAYKIGDILYSILSGKLPLNVKTPVEQFQLFKKAS
jgi:DNA (cytosine-5)-methyltransferase 1